MSASTLCNDAMHGDALTAGDIPTMESPLIGLQHYGAIDHQIPCADGDGEVLRVAPAAAREMALTVVAGSAAVRSRQIRTQFEDHLASGKLSVPSAA